MEDVSRAPAFVTDLAMVPKIVLAINLGVRVTSVIFLMVTIYVQLAQTYRLVANNALARAEVIVTHLEIVWTVLMEYVSRVPPFVTGLAMVPRIFLAINMGVQVTDVYRGVAVLHAGGNKK